MTAGNVVFCAEELIGQVLLLHPAAGEVVGVFIGEAMAKGLGAGIMRIAQMLGHAATGAAAHIVARTRSEEHTSELQSR